MSVFDHSLFHISHQNNRLLFVIEYVGVRNENNRTDLTIADPRINLSIELTHHIVPDRQHPLLHPDSLQGARAHIYQTVVEHPLGLFSGEHTAATSAVEAMIMEMAETITFDIRDADSSGRLIWRSSFDCLYDINPATDEAHLHGIADAAARASTEIMGIVSDSRSWQSFTDIDFVVRIVKRTIVDADLYSSLRGVVEGWSDGDPVPEQESEMNLSAFFEKVTHNGNESNELDCVICIREVPIGTQVCRLLCSHMFHENCILPWLTKSATCPICRSHLSKLLRTQ